MAGLSLPLPDQILALLRARGGLSARDLQAATGMSQPSVSLALATLGERVCRVGAARSTRYFATQDILGLAARQPLQLTDANGYPNIYGELIYLANGGVYVESMNGVSWLSPPNALPWFLAPIKLQGFFARSLATLRPDFPADSNLWITEQHLYMAVQHVTDPPGAFSVGQLQGRFVREAPIDATARKQHYDKIAAAIGNTLPRGSSAGGEQPKFIAEIGKFASSTYQHAIVKFSPPHGTPFGDRWRALLHLERLALDVLREHGVAAAECEIIASATRTYLQSRRFDRIGFEGKRHVVAIGALHQEFVGGAQRNWVHTCEKLVAKKMLSPSALGCVVTIFAFGQYIGNTDMHFGNLSFFIDDVTKPAPRLAPVYDMLPMMWRPDTHSGGLDVTPVRQQAEVISTGAGYAPEHAQARAWAILFWQRAAQLAVLNDTMREACLASAERLKTNFS